MTNPGRSKPRRYIPFLTFFLSTILVSSFIIEGSAAETGSAPAVSTGGSSTPRLPTFALLSKPAAKPPWKRHDDREKAVRTRLNQARDVLEELRVFAGTARGIIEMGQEIAELREDNRRLQQALASSIESRDNLHQKLAGIETRPTLLLQTVLAHWLVSEHLSRRDVLLDQRLNTTIAGWAASQNRLDALARLLEKRRSQARDLRAKTAALTVEIARTRREIFYAQQETRLAQAERQAIELSTKRLRQQRSADLQDMPAAR